MKHYNPIQIQTSLMIPTSQRSWPLKHLLKMLWHTSLFACFARTIPVWSQTMVHSQCSGVASATHGFIASVLASQMRKLSVDSFTAVKLYNPKTTWCEPICSYTHISLITATLTELSSAATLRRSQFYVCLTYRHCTQVRVCLMLSLTSLWGINCVHLRK